MKEKVCANTDCGEVFAPNAKNRVYCSIICNTSYGAEALFHLMGDKAGYKDPESTGKNKACERCGERRARKWYSMCMSCSACWLCRKEKPLSGKDVCASCRNKQLNSNREYQRKRYWKDPEFRNE